MNKILGYLVLTIEILAISNTGAEFFFGGSWDLLVLPFFSIIFVITFPVIVNGILTYLHLGEIQFAEKIWTICSVLLGMMIGISLAAQQFFFGGAVLLALLTPLIDLPGFDNATLGLWIYLALLIFAMFQLRSKRA